MSWNESVEETSSCFLQVEDLKNTDEVSTESLEVQDLKTTFSFEKTALVEHMKELHQKLIKETALHCQQRQRAGALEEILHLQENLMGRMIQEHQEFMDFIRDRDVKELTKKLWELHEERTATQAEKEAISKENAALKRQVHELNMKLQKEVESEVKSCDCLEAEEEKSHKTQ